MKYNPARGRAACTTNDNACLYSAFYGFHIGFIKIAIPNTCDDDTINFFSNQHINLVTILANQTGGLSVEAKVRQIDGLFRVFVGPYPTRDDARRALDLLRDTAGLEGTVRTP